MQIVALHFVYSYPSQESKYINITVLAIGGLLEETNILSKPTPVSALIHAATMVL